MQKKKKKVKAAKKFVSPSLVHFVGLAFFYFILFILIYLVLLPMEGRDKSTMHPASHY
jgi:hypothetical protein